MVLCTFLAPRTLSRLSRDPGWPSSLILPPMSMLFLFSTSAGAGCVVMAIVHVLRDRTSEREADRVTCILTYNRNDALLRLNVPTKLCDNSHFIRLILLFLPCRRSIIGLGIRCS